LSSGCKINSAADDAAGLAIATEFETQASGNAVAKENAQIGVNLLQTAEGDMETIKDHLQKIRDLTVQAANGTYSATERNMLASEANSRIDEINRIVATSTFSDIKLLDGSTTNLKLQIGADSGANNQLNVGSAISKCTATALAANLTKTNLSTAFASSDTANAYISTIDGALNKLSNNLSKSGATQNILESIIENLDVKIENIQSSLSTIQDTDVASEASNMTRLQIMQSMQTTILAQANSSPAVVLNLL